MALRLEHPDSTVADVARVGLSCGSFDALRAVDFARRFPPHFHDTFAIGVIESGAARIRTRRGEWVARAGSILAFAPGEIHSAVPLAATGWSYRMIYPSAEVVRVAGVGPAEPATSFRAPVLDDDRLGRELLRAQSPLMDGADGPSVEGRLLGALRRLLARHAADGQGGDHARRLEAELVERARTYLHAHLAEPLRLATVADVCGVNSFRLIRMFGRVLGVSPYAYLVQLRVNRAQALLRDAASVAEAACACGFADQSHLTRTFKRVVGVPPGQYVRSVRRASR